MTRVLPLDAIGVAPPRDVVLSTQGIPEGQAVPERVMRLAEDARELYEALSRPRGVLSEISLVDFLDVYEGEGQNAEPAPLPGIAQAADHLALFAATLGGPVSEKIHELFQNGDPALGCMLDGIASERADSAALFLARTFLQELLDRGEADAATRVLPYSPGYCGWHVTGQRRLFTYLNPAQIDIRLSESCLMSPLKSVSGVLVAGAAVIHDFDNNFEFCFDCASWECRERIAALSESPPELAPNPPTTN